MNTQTQAQIYVADQRGCSQTDSHCSYHTFNFGRYSEESRKSFGALHLLNDETLRAGTSLTMSVEQAMLVVLLPVVGGLEYKSELNTESVADDRQTGDFLEPGQAGLLSLTAGMSYTINNPYESETIQFIQLWLVPKPDAFSAGFYRTNFDLSCKNILLPLFGPTDAEMDKNMGSSGFIGKYDGRQEGVFPVKHLDGSMQLTELFVFVLKGAFEVANRLLHEKDGLSLQYRRDTILAFEALSNEAILLLIKLPTSLK